jgi:hypothetical protein
LMSVSGELLTWHDRDAFELGGLYVSGRSDEVLEFVGLVTIRAATTISGIDLPDRYGNASPREPVLLFLNDGRLWPSTRRDFDEGETFQTLDDRAGQEIDVADEVAAQRRSHAHGPTEPSPRSVAVQGLRDQIDRLVRLISSYDDAEIGTAVEPNQLHEAQQLLTRVIEALP